MTKLPAPVQVCIYIRVLVVTAPVGHGQANEPSSYTARNRSCSSNRDCLHNRNAIMFLLATFFNSVIIIIMCLVMFRINKLFISVQTDT